jgi:hypothetical protein
LNLVQHGYPEIQTIRKFEVQLKAEQVGWGEAVFTTLIAVYFLMSSCIQQCGMMKLSEFQKKVCCCDSNEIYFLYHIPRKEKKLEVHHKATEIPKHDFHTEEET